MVHLISHLFIIPLFHCLFHPFQLNMDTRNLNTCNLDTSNLDNTNYNIPCTQFKTATSR